jgi:hypothetical protein
MPIPVDPTDMQTHLPTFTEDLGAGVRLFDDMVFRAGVNAQLDVTYDTGVPGSASLAPATLALDGSPEARSSGIFDMAELGAGMKTDAQIPNEPLWPQAFADFRVTREGIEDRQVFARVNNLLAGKYWSVFSDYGALPYSIVDNSAPAGFISALNQVQLMYVVQLGSYWSITPAIARPNIDDFRRVSGSDVRLRRWPDFVTRLRYRSSEYESAQVAVLVRQMGYEDNVGAEHFEAGWGVSGAVRFRTWGFQNVRLGAVVGEGLGDYLFGLAGDSLAAAPTNGALEAVGAVGAYAGYQMVWTPCLVSTLAYGIADVDDIDLLDGIRNTQNGWINLIWAPNDKVAVGFEYQYGFRERQDGRRGDNHHIQLSIGVTTTAKSEAQRAASAADIRGFKASAGLDQAPERGPWERL